MFWKKVFLVIFSLIVLRISAQTALPYTYNKYADLLDSTQDIGFQSLEQNGTIFTMGETYYWGLNSFGFITSVRDTMGTLQHKHNFIFPNFNGFSLKKIIKNSESSIMGVGFAYNDADTINDLDLILVKLNNQGDTVFTKIFRDTGSVIPHAIIPYYNHTFLVLVVHAHDYNNAEFNRTNLMVIDSMGNVLKSTFTPPSLYIPYFLMQDTIKHEVYVMGTNKSQPGQNFYIDNFLRCFDDTALSLKFTKQNISNFANDYIYGATYYKGKFYVTFSAEQWFPPIPIPGNILKLYKMKLNGQILQKTAIAFNPPDTLGSAGSSQVIADNGNIMFAGYNSYTGFNMYFTDTMLSPPCLAAITPPDTNSNIVLYDIGLTASKRLIFSGHCWPVWVTPSLTTGHWQALSLDYRIFTEADCGQFVSVGETYSEQDHLMAFPNPTSGELTIVGLERANVQKTSLLNVLGIECSAPEEFSENQVHLELSNQKPGIYFYRILFKDLSSQVLKLIKE